MQEWLARLSPRERIMVLACVVFVSIALAWSVAVRPLYQGNASLAERVASKQSQLATFQELAGRIAPGMQGGTEPAFTGTNESIVLLIDRTTRERQLAGFLKRNQPDGTVVRIRFEGAPFDALVGWLGELRERYGMTIVSATFDASGPGRVNSSIELRHSGL